MSEYLITILVASAALYFTGLTVARVGTEAAVVSAVLAAFAWLGVALALAATRGRDDRS